MANSSSNWQPPEFVSASSASKTPRSSGMADVAIKSTEDIFRINVWHGLGSRHGSARARRRKPNPDRR